MVFVACGLNHKTAPLSLREKVALPATLQANFLYNILKVHTLSEAAILSTCNRTEVYCDIAEPNRLIEGLALEYQLSIETLRPFLYTYQGPEAVRHMLRVACGLDSMMIGEPQILGQMKRAYQQARELGTVQTQIGPIFESVFSASKRIRTQSGIGANPISIAYAAVQLISRLFSNFKTLKVFLIGSGEITALVAKYLHQQGVQQFLIASRTPENAQKLSNSYGGKTVSITDIPQYLFEADVLVSATSCPLPFINKSLVEQALLKRNHAPMFLLDLAVPRDIEANVSELNQVHLYNIDDLHCMITKGMDERRLAASKAEQLVERELNNYLRRHRTLKVKNLLCDYRMQMHQLAQFEANRALKQLTSGQCQSAVLNELSQRLVNKLTHSPTVGLKQLASDDREDLLVLAQYLFQSTNQLASYEEIT
ncbi:MAG: glutamyl-tRNA reductase [Legionella sp.]|nr:glutamyl-tRNA reductase [Legionella sp.]